MRIPFNAIRTAAIVYVSLPALLFLALWLRLSVAILCSVALVIAVLAWAGRIGHGQARLEYSTMHLNNDQKQLNLAGGTLVIIALVAITWCLIGGQSGMFYQTDDWGIRNAIFRDLITHSWPVFYNGGNDAMSYYIGYWLPAASIGKILLRLGLSLDAVWSVSNCLLLLWTAAGIFLLELLVLAVIRPHTVRRQVLCVFMLVLFSTPDALGSTIVRYWPEAIKSLHLEWWARIGQYSSNTTCLFWVFNQCVVPWICTLCFLAESDCMSYGILMVCCFNSGPIPAVGLLFLMIFQLAHVVVSHKDKTRALVCLLRDALSIQNLMSILCVIPIVLFFSTNSAIGKTTLALAPNALEYPLWFPTEPRLVKRFFAFLAIEGLLIPSLLFKRCRSLPLYWAVIITLIMCPFIRIGQAADFCMRASIPALMALCMLAMETLCREENRNLVRFPSTIALVLVLLCGTVTPAIEIWRNVSNTASAGPFTIWNDEYTLEGGDFSKKNYNFVCQNPSQTIFYQWLCR